MSSELYRCICFILIVLCALIFAIQQVRVWNAYERGRKDYHEWLMEPRSRFEDSNAVFLAFSSMGRLETNHYGHIFMDDQTVIKFWVERPRKGF